MLQYFESMRNITAGREQRAVDLLIRQPLAVHMYVGAQLDERLDLHLPLVLFSEAGTGQHIEKALG